MENPISNLCFLFGPSTTSPMYLYDPDFVAISHDH